MKKFIIKSMTLKRSRIIDWLMLNIVSFAFVISLLAQQPEKIVNWDSWQFLLGDWTGEGGGNEPEQGLGTCTFYLDLQNTILVRKNHAEYPATNDRPASLHDDLMIIYQNHNATHAIYFDNEGHVINYAVEFSHDQNTVTFTSEIMPAAPRFRLTYTKGAEQTVKLKFKIAPPGKPDAFSNYIDTVLHRK